MPETKDIGKEKRVELLQTMLEDMTEVFKRMYQGENEKVSLNKIDVLGKPVRISYISLERQKTKRSLLNLFKPTNYISEDLIFAVSEQFSDKPNGENNLGVLVESQFLGDENVRVIICSALNQYVNNCAPINVHEEKFRYALKDKQYAEKNKSNN